MFIPDMQFAFTRSRYCFETAKIITDLVITITMYSTFLLDDILLQICIIQHGCKGNRF